MIPVTGLCLLVLTFVNSVLFVELVKVQRLGCLTLFNRIIYILRYTVFKVRFYVPFDTITIQDHESHVSLSHIVFLNL